MEVHYFLSLDYFFDELSYFLIKANRYLKNLIFMGHFDIDIDIWNIDISPVAI